MSVGTGLGMKSCSRRFGSTEHSSCEVEMLSLGFRGDSVGYCAIHSTANRFSGVYV